MSKPEGYEEMLEVAKVLAGDFPCVRVDLYYVNKKVYFGELTFCHFGGVTRFDPEDFDVYFGKFIRLPMNE